MTVTYTAEVASSYFGCFLKLLARWKGSIYKLLWKDVLVFLVAYYSLSLLYRFGLNEYQRTVFERISMYCDYFNNLIPVAFVLGFYVSIVVQRWWDQYRSIPWPDRMSIFVTAHLHGHDDRGRLMRRTILRYLNLAFVMTLSAISSQIKKRFPTDDHFVESGLLLPGELKIIQEIKTPHSKYFVPIVWATSLITRARKEGRIKDDFAVKTLVDEVNGFRGLLGDLYSFDWISVPLVYTQVVTLAVYTFFLSCLLGRQFLDSDKGYEGHRMDMYIPVFTLLQFFFYMGWLKVAETLVNPFGEDDDDFEINWVIDRNLQISYLVVDEMHQEYPELIKDAYWDDVDFELPYTAAAEQFQTEPYLGSAVDISVSGKDAEYVPTMGSIPENELEHITLRNVTSVDIPIPQRFRRLTSNESIRSIASSKGSPPKNGKIERLRQALKRSTSTVSRNSGKKGSQTSIRDGSNARSPGSPNPSNTRTDDDIFQMEISSHEATPSSSKARLNFGRSISGAQIKDSAQPVSKLPKSPIFDRSLFKTAREPSANKDIDKNQTQEMSLLTDTEYAESSSGSNTGTLKAGDIDDLNITAEQTFNEHTMPQDRDESTASLIAKA
ncbi:bestrophin-2-like isoform X2 [Tubulanus polymorphus]|uniref:bestrophin-2-like isoform X2 n=1 Tax=Tubulanus polymorphus TaxID=672921 RepID=UPI003DA265F4